MSDGTVLKAMQRLLATGQLQRRRAKVYINRRSAPATGSGTTGNRALELSVLITNRKPSERFQQAIQSLTRFGYDPRLVYCPTDGATQFFLEQQLRQPGQPFLALNLPSGLFDSHLSRLRKAGIPAVGLDAEMPGYPALLPDPSDIFRQAVQAFLQAGHRRLGYLKHLDSNRQWSKQDRDAQHFQEVVRKNTSSDVQILVSASDDCVPIFREWMHKANRPSALLLRSWKDLTEQIFEAAESMGIRIPEDLSILQFGDGPSHQVKGVRITRLCAPHGRLVRIIHGLIAEQIEFFQERGSLPRPVILRYQWHLVEGTSLARIASPTSLTLDDANSSRRHAMLRAWPEERQARRDAAHQLNHSPFAAGQPTDVFQNQYLPMDLSCWTSRLLNKQYSWFGSDPLLHLPPGERNYHQVPLIIPALQEGKAGAIVLRSARANAKSPEPLPSHVTIPIQRRVSEVYLLHGAGYIGAVTPFAWYRFRYQSGRADAVIPVAGQGRLLRGGGEPAAGDIEFNVQDWWPTYPQSAQENALPVVVTAPSGDPFEYERYLYLLRWKNPVPEAMVESVMLEADPERQETVALLSLTLRLQV